MQLKNVKRWANSGFAGYYFAILGVFLAFCIRFTLHPLLQSGLPMTFFILNTILIALFFGYKPSLLTVVISAPLALFFFVPPYYSFNMPTPGDLFIYLSYILVAIIAVVIIEWLQRERFKAILVSRVSDSRYRLLAQASYSLRIAQSNENQNNS
ncbi:protein of unknown function [Polynucleobacter meluiroseus]|uniref:Sensor protein KdpD transmembrane domain-containing protein n=1 Tax=Polynucleobacter meluiroseus TaxID=1938814 RepID=A0A240E260_9BURK|nr:DUF4118 domain-containing protein [Polynucleobacter meluiroseus]SNX28581.1 protein of unknown function [Polynucleobacter meluiroseus]